MENLKGVRMSKVCYEHSVAAILLGFKGTSYMEPLGKTEMVQQP